MFLSPCQDGDRKPPQNFIANGRSEAQPQTDASTHKKQTKKKNRDRKKVGQTAARVVKTLRRSVLRALRQSLHAGQARPSQASPGRGPSQAKPNRLEASPGRGPSQAKPNRVFEASPGRGPSQAKPTRLRNLRDAEPKCAPLSRGVLQVVHLFLFIFCLVVCESS